MGVALEAGVPAPELAGLGAPAAAGVEAAGWLEPPAEALPADGPMAIAEEADSTAQSSTTSVRT